MQAARRGFVYKEKTLLSGIDPAGRAEHAAAAIPVKDRTLYFCPSPLYGYGLAKLLARLADEAPHSALLCVEAEPELYDLALRNFDPALLADERLCLTGVCEAAALCALARRKWGPRHFRRVEILRLTGGWQLFPERYEALAEILRQEIAIDWGNALTLTRLGRRYIRNALTNLALIPACPSIAELSFGDAPVLVLGAGPSLDALLEGLAARFGSALSAGHTARQGRPFRLICVDTCLPALRERNIVPDLAVILESQHWNLRDFIGSRGWDLPAAVDLSALPASARVLSGEVFLCMTEWTGLRIFSRLDAAGLAPARIPPLGSVGLAAIELARRLSRGTLIAGGIDFSFSLDAYHARSTPGHADKLRRHDRFHDLFNADAAFGPAAFNAMSKDGRAVRSDPAMRGYRDLFAREFSGSANTRLFDLIGSGLPLGLPSLSPEAAFDILAAGPASAGTARDPGRAGQRPPEERAARAERLRDFIRDERGRLEELRQMLCGETSSDLARLGALIDECDFLWAHFPDYAAAGGRRPGADEIAAKTAAAISFLKRLRAEIDPALALLAGGY